MRIELSIALASILLPLTAARAQDAPLPYPYPLQAPIAPAMPAEPAYDPNGVVPLPPAMPLDEAERAQYVPPPGCMAAPPPQQAWAPPPQAWAPPPQAWGPPPCMPAPTQQWAPPPCQATPPPCMPQYYPPPQPYFAPPPPPAYVPPAPRRVVARPAQAGCRGGMCRLKSPNSARFFSIGGRASALFLNQQIGDDNVVLGGGGFELRFRSRGHFGFEGSVDFLRGEFQLNGPVVRDSMPVQLASMIYIFRNTDERKFNMYFLGGFTYMGTKMTLTDPAGLSVEQEFTEYGGLFGIGAEVRLRWFAIRADVRGFSLWRDDSAGAAPLYGDLDGAPVPQQSYGMQGTIGVAAWF